MKNTKKECTGTSFHGVSIQTNVSDLKRVLGNPDFEDNTGEDKVNYQWTMQTDEGDIFTVYDWKEYHPLNDTETISFHIGGFTEAATLKAKAELTAALHPTVI